MAAANSAHAAPAVLTSLAPWLPAGGQPRLLFRRSVHGAEAYRSRMAGRVHWLLLVRLASGVEVGGYGAVPAPAAVPRPAGLDDSAPGGVPVLAEGVEDELAFVFRAGGGDGEGGDADGGLQVWAPVHTAAQRAEIGLPAVYHEEVGVHWASTLVVDVIHGTVSSYMRSVYGLVGSREAAEQRKQAAQGPPAYVGMSAALSMLPGGHKVVKGDQVEEIEVWCVEAVQE